MYHEVINLVKTKLCQVLISMHHFLRGPRQRCGTRGDTQQLTGTRRRARKWSKRHYKLIPIVYKSLKTRLFQPVLLGYRIYVTLERRREIQEHRLTGNMCTVWFYLALVAAHPAGALRVVTFLRSLGGSSWTDCAAVMS